MSSHLLSKHAKYTPKHRGAAPATRATQVPKNAVRNTLVLSTLAVAATGTAVAGGLLGQNPAVDPSAADLGAIAGPDAAAAATPAPRADVVSRDLDRSAVAAVDPTKAAALAQDAGPGVVRSEKITPTDPRDIARSMLGQFGWSADQFGCLDSLWTRESGWNVSADNPSSSAYGIPQALPGSKMASAGADWATNPATQIEWGLGYIRDSYGSPCAAWGHSQGFGWY